MRKTVYCTGHDFHFKTVFLETSHFLTFIFSQFFKTGPGPGVNEKGDSLGKIGHDWTITPLKSTCNVMYVCTCTFELFWQTRSVPGWRVVTRTWPIAETTGAMLWCVWAVRALLTFTSFFLGLNRQYWSEGGKRIYRVTWSKLTWRS